MTPEEREAFYEKTGLAEKPAPKVKSISPEIVKRVEEFIERPDQPLSESEHAELERQGNSLVDSVQDRYSHAVAELEATMRRDDPEWFQKWGDFRKGQNTDFFNALAPRIRSALNRYATGEGGSIPEIARRLKHEWSEEAARESFTEPKVDPVDQYIAERQRTLQDQRGYGSSPDCGRSAGDNLGASARAEVKK